MTTFVDPGRVEPYRAVFSIPGQSFRDEPGMTGGETPTSLGIQEVSAQISSDDPFIQALIDQGIISYGETIPGVSYSNGESGPGYIPAYRPVEIDFSKLPSTQYGKNFALYDEPSGRAAGGFRLINPDLRYRDPNYGWITPKANLIDPSNETDMYDMIGPVVMSVVLGGAGLAFGAGAAELTAVNAARSVQGALVSDENIGATIGGIAGSLSGIPYGSTIGSLAGQAVEHGPENVNWGAGIGSIIGSASGIPFGSTIGSIGGGLVQKTAEAPQEEGTMVASAGKDNITADLENEIRRGESLYAILTQGQETQQG